jgi:hypothetical protein
LIVSLGSRTDAPDPQKFVHWPSIGLRKRRRAPPRLVGVHATKEPYHRQAVGYEGPDPARCHPEYLFARRGRGLMLNLVDAPVEVDMPKGIFDAALAFIQEGLVSGGPVLVHCNQGVSRSASIGLLFLRRYTGAIQADDYREAEEIYGRIYPLYSPGKAIRWFVTTHWKEYAPPGTQSS